MCGVNAELQKSLFQKSLAMLHYLPSPMPVYTAFSLYLLHYPTSWEISIEIFSFSQNNDTMVINIFSKLCAFKNHALRYSHC